MPEHIVSRAMSTQHPDNVNAPFFSDSHELGGEDEIKEVFYAFSHLHCKEQLWDCEGKEVDNFVVKKLLNKYEPFFRRNKLGKDLFLTLRVPNPSIERSEAKILLETLESIPRNYDAAKLFYGEDISPIFEVSLPMTTSSKELIRLSEYYRNHVVGKQNYKFKDGISISEWIGDFQPDKLRIIPLIEDKDSILDPKKIIYDFITHEKPQDYQRVWLARSDPALNYGNLATVLMLKVSLQRLKDIEERLSIDILPILGCGSSPFRGNFKPSSIKDCIDGYPSVHTFTLQSAFKYDYPIEDVVGAIEHLESTTPSKPISIDEEITFKIIDKLVAEYRKQISMLGGIVNQISAFVPSRRKRKLHIGLFGYSRNVAELKLPRAIAFCASLYSIGLPPEMLGLNALSENEVDYVKDVYKGFSRDLCDSLRYYNPESSVMFPNELTKHFDKISSLAEFVQDRSHAKVTSIICNDLKKGEKNTIAENITRAGFIRGFLG